MTGPDPDSTTTVVEQTTATTAAAGGLAVVQVRAAAPWDRSAMARSLYTALGLDRHRTRPRVLADTEDLIARELRRSTRLVIVADAHQLRTTALQLLYALWAHGVPDHFPLVLTGDDRLATLLRHPAVANLESCVRIRHRVPVIASREPVPAAAPGPDTTAPAGSPAAPGDACAPAAPDAALAASGQPPASAPDGGAALTEAVPDSSGPAVPAEVEPGSSVPSASAAAAGGGEGLLVSSAPAPGSVSAVSSGDVVGPKQVSVARPELYKLVDAACDETRNQVTLIAKGKLTAALVPLGRLDAGSRARAGSWPSWPRTKARPKLGDLVRDAVGTPTTPGVPQVLCDRTTPVAVLVAAELLPAGGGLVVVPGGPGSGEAAAEGGDASVSAPAAGVPVGAAEAGTVPSAAAPAGPGKSMPVRAPEAATPPTSGSTPGPVDGPAVSPSAAAVPSSAGPAGGPQASAGVPASSGPAPARAVPADGMPGAGGGGGEAGGDVLAGSGGAPAPAPVAASAAGGGPAVAPAGVDPAAPGVPVAANVSGARAGVAGEPAAPAVPVAVPAEPVTGGGDAAVTPSPSPAVPARAATSAVSGALAAPAGAERVESGSGAVSPGPAAPNDTPAAPAASAVPSPGSPQASAGNVPAELVGGAARAGSGPGVVPADVAAPAAGAVPAGGDGVDVGIVPGVSGGGPAVPNDRVDHQVAAAAAVPSPAAAPAAPGAALDDDVVDGAPAAGSSAPAEGEDDVAAVLAGPGDSASDNASSGNASAPVSAVARAEGVPVGEAGTAAAPSRLRALRGLDATVLDELLTPAAPAAPAAPRVGGPVSFGLPALDHALATLTPGRLILLVAAPGAGASLLAAAAARHTALTHHLPVLYAASGLSRADVAARIVAAHAPVDYRRLRTGALTAAELEAAAGVRAQLAGAPLLIDDGTGLTADAIAQTVPDVEGLALVVVDRLQHAHDPAMPLSGPALPAAARTLAHLARTHQVPVLAVLDTDDPHAVAALAPGLTLTLTRAGEHAELAVVEPDFGCLAVFPLTADLACARFTEAPALFDAAGILTAPGGRALVDDVLAAATPFLAETPDPDQDGPDGDDFALPPASLVLLLRYLRSSLSPGYEAYARRFVTELLDHAAHHPRLPETAEGRRLAAALTTLVEYALAHGYRPDDAGPPDSTQQHGTPGAAHPAAPAVPAAPGSASLPPALTGPYAPVGPVAGPSCPPVTKQAVTGTHSTATSTAPYPGRPAGSGLPAAAGPQAPASPADTATAAAVGPAGAAPLTGPVADHAAPGTSTTAPAPAPAGAPVAGESLAVAEAELLEAAFPFLAGAQGGLSARLTGTMAALRDARTATATGERAGAEAAGARPEPEMEQAAVLVGLRRTMADLAARTPRMPETPEGARLQAALAAYATAHSAPAAPASTAPAPAPSHTAGTWPVRFPQPAAAPAGSPAAPGPDGGLAAVETELLDAAAVFTSGPEKLSAAAMNVLQTLRAALHPENTAALPAARARAAELATRRLRLPKSPDAARLRAALDAYATAAAAAGIAPDALPPAPAAALSVAEPAPQPPAATPAAPGDQEASPAAGPAEAPEAPDDEEEVVGSESFQDTTAPPEADVPAARTSARVYTFFLNKITDAVDQALQEHDGDVEAATKALVRKAVPDSMALFKLTRVGGNYVHTAYPRSLDFLAKPAQGEPDEVWEARHKWRNEPLAAAIKKGTHDPLDVTALDTNAAYLSAFKTHLPIGTLLHDPNGGFDRRRAGIHRVDHFEWTHPHLPSPLGNRIEPGPYYLDDATLRLLIRCHELDLCEAPRILESWTSGASEALLEKFRRVLQQARQTAIENEDTATIEYVKAMYSKFTSTIGHSAKNSEIRRPEWVHTIRSQANASLWLKAFKAHQNGLILVQVSGVDELHVAGGDWRQVFKEGRKPAEMKEKRLYTLGGK
ncbi:DnaB-like helicase C-terminal domain-containing protein [Streptomyces aureoversilis]|uniref:DnaB-like helicase C-terminal domain-containing protein n=1 Tax=Streptomyces aureoversilis TaxID=67277 RepID=A0ABW0A660_9ACTN